MVYDVRVWTGLIGCTGQDGVVAVSGVRGGRKLFGCTVRAALRNFSTLLPSKFLKAT